jgi:CheY-like chemotaxis protein
MKRIGILVSDNIKKKWQTFIDENEFTTISKLIRKAVNFYIDSQSKILYLENLSKLSHDLKEPLTSIKGFSQLILENYSNNLDVNVLLRIKEIFNQSNYLEQKINEILTEVEPSETEYDIMIIEDDTSTIMVLNDYFELKGYKCRGVISGGKGINELKNFIPKIILLDIILPDIDGYEVCKQIKSNNRFKDIPIYYITAIPGSEVEKRLEETGANGYFLKPFDFSEFEILFKHFKNSKKS